MDYRPINNGDFCGSERGTDVVESTMSTAPPAFQAEPRQNPKENAQRIYLDLSGSIWI